MTSCVNLYVAASAVRIPSYSLFAAVVAWVNFTEYGTTRGYVAPPAFDRRMADHNY